MLKQMLINALDPEESRIAILEDGVLEEIYVERQTDAVHVGDIYKGRVTNVLPSLQAAFVDLGVNKNGFLHVSDLLAWSERQGQSIDKVLQRGQEVVVQVTKEGIGDKGPSVTEWISLPGRFLVLMPYARKLGVSRKIVDEEKRKELLEMLRS